MAQLFPTILLTLSAVLLGITQTHQYINMSSVGSASGQAGTVAFISRLGKFIHELPMRLADRALTFAVVSLVFVWVLTRVAGLLRQRESAAGFRKWLSQAAPERLFLVAYVLLSVLATSVALVLLYESFADNANSDAFRYAKALFFWPLVFISAYAR